MNFKMKFALAAAVLGAGTLSAQEMGAAVAPAAPAAAAPAAAAPAIAQVQQAAQVVAAVPAMEAPEDDGPQIVVENQKYAPTAKASKATDANAAVGAALRERGFAQGYDSERGSIIQIGQAMDNMDNPSSPDFMTVRELLVRQAELDAKIQIARVVRQQMSGSTRVNTPGTQENADFRQKFAEQIAAVEQQKAKVAELLQMLEQAEGNKLAGTTVDDQWKKVMDGIIKRLDAKYSKDDIAVEKQQQYLQIKAAYDQAKAQLDDLTQKKDALYPRKTVETEAEAYAEMKLCGAVDLVQAESWDGKFFHVAVAVVWSPKLQERALLTLGCGAPAGGKPGEKSLDAWLQEQADRGELARLVGTKQYVDDKGRQYVLGFSAAEVPADATDYEDAIAQADLLAQQAVGFYLFSEGDGSQKVKAAMAKFKGKSTELAGAVSGGMTQAMPKDMAISGLGKVYSAKCRNELSGKDIYVSVAAVDSVLAGKSSEILRTWYAGAAEAVATSQYLAAEQQGMSQALNEVKKSGVAAQAGLAAGQQAVLGELKARQAERAPAAPAAPAAVMPVAQPAAPGTPKKGVFVGGQNFSDDF